MVVKKFNYYRFFVFIVVLISIIVGVIMYVNKKNYEESNEYKLLQVGYSLDEINYLQEKYNDKINDFLNRKYDANIIEFMKEKYFIYNNLDKYLEYKKSNKKIDNTSIVSTINTESNIEWLDNEKETDISKNELMLVNKIYGLNEEYVPSDLVDASLQYAYSGIKISESILTPLTELIDDGRTLGYNFIISDGYRSYQSQETLYNKYANNYGMSEADKFVAHAGHSEYQTGLAFDLGIYGKNYDDVKNSEEYIWLKDNAYKYGFIFRYTEDKESLTGFKSSTWHLRYVGYSAAELMKNENLCFEEYYSYFVQK